MHPEYKDLLIDALKAHPGPWKQEVGYGDNGGRFTSIIDTNGEDVFDGESGHLSRPVFDLLLNFPEIAGQFGIKV
jgi:hypothetical protein